jgi:hypothetical protein
MVFFGFREILYLLFTFVYQDILSIGAGQGAVFRSRSPVSVCEIFRKFLGRLTTTRGGRD